MLWIVHWVIPLYKRKSVYDPRNYRGIHLTSQISKVAARVVASLFVPQLVYTGAFGRNQFAYMPERGARDALAQLVLTWISLFAKKRKIAVHCSDVLGAFDKVNSRRLLCKLRVPLALLGGHNIVARRDRNDGRSGGGILSSPLVCKVETFGQ